MTTPDSAVTALLQPMGDSGPPVAAMSGDIPAITFSTWPTKFDIHLGNHNDPERWLRETAAVLVDLADTIFAARIGTSA